MAAPKHYSTEQKVSVLATLAANGGNISKTSRETGVDRVTLRAWRAGELNNSPEVTTQKEALADAYLKKVRRTREALLDRMLTLSKSEKDLFKVSGAFKIVSEAASEAEVQEALAAVIRDRAGEMN